MTQNPPSTHHYYYGNEADQYTFYRLPKLLFTDNRYRHLSDGVKILYGLMLDRMGLSMRNGWLDKLNRVYIFFALDDVTEQMNCKNDKAVKMLAELDTVKGVGLIERVRQGQGKPAIIYMRKFYDTAEVLTSEKPKSGLPVLPKSGLRKNRSQDYGKSECNNTNTNYTESNDTDHEQDLSFPSFSTTHSIQPESVQKGNERMDQCRSLVRANIEYPIIAEHLDRTQLDEIVELVVETVCTTRKTISISGDDFPAKVVKSRLLKLNSQHIEYVFMCLDENTTMIRNIKKYLLTVLFNAPATMEIHCTTIVNHELSERES